jgi:citrate lyase subunit beta/citryl-CoA lyase
MTRGPFRSLLFAPGNQSRKVEKVFAAGADVAILDLEDAVPLAEKENARGAAVEGMKRPRECLGLVRVNAEDTEFCEGDLGAVVGPWLDGIILPKVETAAQLLSVDKLIQGFEQGQGMEPGGIDLLPIIETAKGVNSVTDIAGCGSRAGRLSFGAVDLAKDLGMRKSAARARDLGFQGKFCIHPDQVAVVNEAFTPSDEDVAKAEKIVAAFEQAEAAGSAAIQVDGFFVDYPIVDQARRTLELIKIIGGK